MKKRLVITTKIVLIILFSSSIPIFVASKLIDTSDIKESDIERIIDNEKTACRRLALINFAFKSYYNDHNQTYPKSLSELAKASPPYIPSYFGKEGGTAKGYKYKIVDSSESSYLIVAYPDPYLPNKLSGRYFFCVMEDGLIRRASEGISIDSYVIAKKLKVIE